MEFEEFGRIGTGKSAYRHLGNASFPVADNPVSQDLARRACRVLTGHKKGGGSNPPFLRNYLVERI
jgi:hypothetical protein